MALSSQIRDGEFTSTIYSLIRDHKYAEATHYLNNQLNTYTNSRAALSLLGYCYYQNQDYVNASDCYEQLCQLMPDNQQYKLYYAQSLHNASLYAEAMKVVSQIDDPKYKLEVMKLQAAIKHGQEDCQGSRSLVEQCPKDDPDTEVNKGCLMYAEQNYQQAAAHFKKAIEIAGGKPQIIYALALCCYKMGNFHQATQHVGDIVERGIKNHPELNIGITTEGIDSRSVGNTYTLYESALVEAFNLKAALFFQSGNLPLCHEALTDMPFRAEHELDPVTLHNTALMHMDDKPSQGFEKLQWLLKQNPCPDETFQNLLLLYVKYEYYDLASDVLAENTHLTFKCLTPFVYDFLDAVLTRQTSPDEAYAKLEALTSRLSERMAQLVKACQEARQNKDEVAIKKSVTEFDEAVEQFLPVFMQQGKIFWDAKRYDQLEKLFRKSVDHCSDRDSWKLNVGHVLFMQKNKHKEAIGFYEPLVRKHMSNGILSLSAIVLANLCVSYILCSKNEDAEEIMRAVEKEEEDSAVNDPDKKVFHLCIINMVIGTLYCAKGNYDFGLSRVIKALEPYQRKLGPDTWFYAKRCLLSTFDNMARQLTILQDSTLDEIIGFLSCCELYGKNVQAHSDVLGHDELTPGANTVAYEARQLKALLLDMLNL